MAFAQVNYLAVIVASIASMAVGMFWFSPAGFGKAWMKELGIKEKDMNKEGAWKHMLAGFITTVISAIVLSVMILMTGAQTIGQAAYLGFLLWLGFSMPLNLGPVLWQRKSLRLFAITGTFWLLTTILMAIIIGAWL